VPSSQTRLSRLPQQSSGGAKEERKRAVFSVQFVNCFKFHGNKSEQANGVKFNFMLTSKFALKLTSHFASTFTLNLVPTSQTRLTRLPQQSSGGSKEDGKGWHFSGNGASQECNKNRKTNCV
jgi:hypothetical protein